MSVDDLLGSLHDDKVQTLDERLRAIELELNRRRLVSAEHTTRLFEQLQVLNEEILRLQPESDYGADPHHQRRAPLEREHRELERELTEELRDRWRDEQQLRREQRELKQARQEQWQHYERNMKDYA